MSWLSRDSDSRRPSLQGFPSEAIFSRGSYNQMVVAVGWRILVFEEATVRLVINFSQEDASGFQKN